LQGRPASGFSNMLFSHASGAGVVPRRAVRAMQRGVSVHGPSPRSQCCGAGVGSGQAGALARRPNGCSAWAAAKSVWVLWRGFAAVLDSAIPSSDGLAACTAGLARKWRGAFFPSDSSPGELRQSSSRIFWWPRSGDQWLRYQVQADVALAGGKEAWSGKDLRSSGRVGARWGLLEESEPGRNRPGHPEATLGNASSKVCLESRFTVLLFAPWRKALLFHSLGAGPGQSGAYGVAIVLQGLNHPQAESCRSGMFEC